MLGLGGESLVFTTEDPLKVAAVQLDWKRFNPLEAKQLYYVHRIFSTLFPHNFPRFHAVFGAENNRQFTGSIRQRVHSQESDAEPIYPFNYVVNQCKKYGLPLKIDPDIRNFQVGLGGGEYYMDKINLKIVPILLRLNSLTGLLDLLDNYSPQDKNTTVLAVKRLIEITLTDTLS